MAKSKRYAMSGGLAFTEHGDMNKLSRLAAKGWLLDSFAFAGYTLRKGEPRQLTYCVDYNDVSPSELDDYIELFEASGWTRVCSAGNIHVFSAAPGTKPIYTDNETRHEKYRRSVRKFQSLLVVPLLTVIAFILTQMSSFSGGEATVLENICKAVWLIGLTLSVPILMTYAAFRIRLSRVKP